MKVIGITGGVGSGKSLVLEYLRQLSKINAYVIEADRVAHELQRQGEACYEAIVEEFGTGILAGDGSIDRRMLGNLVFSDETKLEKLNGIVHPFVKDRIVHTIETIRGEWDFSKWKAGAGKCGEGVVSAECYVFIEAALLIEDHYDEICDEMWYIYVREDIRRERLKASRGYSDEKITQILSRQLGEEEFRKACRVVIDNNESAEHTYQQIREVLSCRNS